MESGDLVELRAARCTGPIQSNNEAELEAAIEAIEIGKEGGVNIVTDSKYVVNWVQTLVATRGRLPTRKLIQHSSWSMLAYLREQIASHHDPSRIRTRWVKGHRKGGHEDIRGNGMADSAAGSGADLPPVEAKRWKVGITLAYYGPDLGPRGTSLIKQDQTTCNFKQFIKRNQACRRANDAKDKVRDAVLLINRASKAAKENKRRITALYGEGKYISVMSRRYITNNIWAIIKARKGIITSEEAEEKAARCTLCGARDSYRHMALECPHQWKLLFEKWAALKDQDAEKLREWSRRTDPQPDEERIRVIERMRATRRADGVLIIPGEGGFQINEEVMWKLFLRARRKGMRDTQARDWDEFVDRFAHELKKLSDRYTEGVTLNERGDRVTVENTWATPWPLTTKLAEAFNLKTMIFSHPGNADPTYGEHFTPAKEDRFFEASYDGYSVFQRDRELLAFGNPEYKPQEAMDKFYRAVRDRATNKRAFRCVMIIPYGRGGANRDGGASTGLGIIRGAPGITVTELAVTQSAAFAFWKGDFWKTGWKGRGNAPWPVAVIMVQNEAANTQYPVHKAAWKEFVELMTLQCGRGERVRLAAIGKEEVKEVATDDSSENVCAIAVKIARRNTARLRRACEHKKYYISECDLASVNGVLAAETVKDWSEPNSEDNDGRKKIKNAKKTTNADCLVGSMDMMLIRPIENGTGPRPVNVGLGNPAGLP